MIEWYDFYIFGSLAAVIGPLFFPTGNPTIDFLSALATFATGFLVRPFGALVFGRIGDIIGRKYTFLVTLLIMGLSTTVIGLLPTYAQIGLLAPAILVTLRLLQGLALGGEYGGAATYVAEHSPDGRRGFFTSWIQTTASVGLFVSLGVILATRLTLGEAVFREWGWRVPFLASFLLVGMSLYIRLRLKEAPIFAKLKGAGKTARSPIVESFANPVNRKLVILCLLGATAGQGVVWYTGQFYALFFLQTQLKIDFVTANIITGLAIALGTPFFIVFGALSDRIGRKKIMMAGNLLGALTFLPIYWLMSQAVTLPPAGSPATALSTNVNVVLLTFLVWVLMLYVTMVYGPIAAFLVELFPARIRYTSMSLPYHIGNGWFGGLTPLISQATIAATGNIFSGLFWPIGIAAMTFVVGSVALRETHRTRIWDEVHALEQEQQAAPEPLTASPVSRPVSMPASA
jgi:MFS family permease